MKPAIQVGNATVYHGSNLDVLPTLPDNSVDSIITDPPYELGFMGKSWDSTGIAYNVNLWRECLRVLKPGGHLLAFGGTRTWHRLAVAIEDAGFEMRDSIAWLYSSGFPKSHNISIAIDKQAGAMGHRGVRFENSGLRKQGYDVANPTGAPAHQPITPEAQQWEGWGTALKPAFEPITLARKPLDGTVAANTLKWGVGGLNIDASRIGTTVESWPSSRSYPLRTKNNAGDSFGSKDAPTESTGEAPAGRWPANIILDEYTAGLLDEQADASRFFYTSKASKKDRNEGLEDLPETKSQLNSGGIGREISVKKRLADGENINAATTKNFHPTVKPTDLMRYLIKLVTPPNGTILDPFTGSGSTGKAALLDGYTFIGIELTPDYLPIIEHRLHWANQQTTPPTTTPEPTLF